MPETCFLSVAYYLFSRWAAVSSRARDESVAALPLPPTLAHVAVFVVVVVVLAAIQLSMRWAQVRWWEQRNESMGAAVVVGVAMCAVRT